MQVMTKTYAIEVLTAHFQVGGGFSPRGNPGVFLNDQQVETFIIEEATSQPLNYGTKLGQVTTTPAFIPKDEVHILTLDGFHPHEASLMPKPVRLLIFTDSFAIRGTFHTGAETPASDMFVLGGPFFPLTDVEIFSTRPMAVDVNGGAELAYIHRNAVRLFYSQT